MGIDIKKTFDKNNATHELYFKSEVQMLFENCGGKDDYL